MKRNKGITLIALIITIVILIILTAVTINNVMNSNLFNLAKGAAENYVQTGKEEEKAIDKMIGIMQGWKVGDDSKIRPGDVVKITEKDNYTDEDGRTATVPAGFKVSTKSSEQLIEDGLVIQDEQGNEFVWVPCYYDTKPADAPNDLQEYKKHDYSGTGANGWIEYEYTKYKDWTDEATKDKNSYGNASVTKYGGFYIGRYEAGWSGDSGDPETKIAEGSSYVDTLEQAIQQRNVTSQKPVSKKGVFSWNFISQENAKKVSEDMYKNGDGEVKEGSVQSKLVDGAAWDTVTTWINISNVESIKYGNYNNTEIQYSGLYAKHIYAIRRSPDTTTHWLCAKKFSNGSITLKTEEIKEPYDETLADNYAGTDIENQRSHNFWTRYELPTGSLENFKLKNIYDLAGNMWDWTTEVGDHKENSEATTSGDSFAVFRGGSFCDDGTLHPLCCRAGAERATDEYVNVGFRVVLYVK